MQRTSEWWIALVVTVAAAVMTTGLAAGPTSALSSRSPVSASNTISFAEAPGASPNYIFPYLGCRYFSVANVSQFQEMTYRPLYWFGTPGSPDVDYRLSPAKAPVFSNGNETVTIEMKGWKFADGQRVNAQSVMFFLNLYKADPTNYCGYNQGYGIPDQVASATGHGNTVVINFTSAVNPNWILYDYLSELTPMPNSWDVTAPHRSSTCASGAFGAPSTDAACQDVDKYLDAHAATRRDFADSLWTSGADGPWKLIKMDDRGNATFVPNARYSGPVKAQKGVDFVKEEAFTTAHAEETALRSGSVTLGYVDSTVLPGHARAPGGVGANWSAVSKKYRLTTGYTWAVNYAPFNFSSTDPELAIVEQLYIRQALQEALNQAAIIQKVDKGYGVPIDSPLPPDTPPSVSGLPQAIEPVTDPYPYNVTAAKALLTGHGWKLVDGVDACESPGTGATDCGAGIAQGATLNLSIIWAKGSRSLNETINAEVARWDDVGFKIRRTATTLNDVIRDCSAGGSYVICAWGNGQRYAPEYYPSGENLFAPGGGLNVGEYSNVAETAAIESTIFGAASLAAYAELTAQQLPVLFQPQANATGEVLNTLRSLKVNGINGLTANPLQNFMPEYLYVK